MFFLVFAGAVTPDRRVVSFPTGVVQPLFKTVIPRAHRGLQLLASTWLRDAGHNAWLHMINECHLTHLCPWSSWCPNKVIAWFRGAASKPRPIGIGG